MDALSLRISDLYNNSHQYVRLNFRGYLFQIFKVLLEEVLVFVNQLTHLLFYLGVC